MKEKELKNYIVRVSAVSARTENGEIIITLKDGKEMRMLVSDGFKSVEPENPPLKIYVG